MPPYDERAAQARHEALEASIDFMKKKDPVKFAAAQVQAYGRGLEIANSITGKQAHFGSPERMAVVIKLLDIQAEAYISLVDDMKSQECFMEFLNACGNKAFENQTGLPLDQVTWMASEGEWQTIQKRVGFWANEGYKRLIPDANDDDPAQNRPGYGKEIDEWMRREEIKTVDEAAKRLAVSIDTLKSIRSDKGRQRFSDKTLANVLEKTGIKKK